MTVAAAYYGPSGSVLCADTNEVIPGYIKYATKKIAVYKAEGVANLAMVGSGLNGVSIDMVTQRIGAAFLEAKPKNAAALDALLWTVLDDLFPQPHYPKISCEVELLIVGQWAGSTQVYQSCDRDVAMIAGAASIGTGQIVTQALIERYYSPDLPWSLLEIVAAYSVYRAKKMVDGCDGGTDILILPSEGLEVLHVPTSKVEVLEEYSRRHDAAVSRLLFAAPSYPTSRDGFDKALQQVGHDLLAARTAFQTVEESMREMCARLGLDYEKIAADGDAMAARFWM